VWLGWGGIHVAGFSRFSVVSPHWLCVLISTCVGVSVWLGWGGIRVAGFSHFSVVSPHWLRVLMDGCINIRNMLSIEEVK